MRHQTLLRALPIVATMLGRTAGVKVVVGGDEAKTDGKVIYLPALDPEDTESEILAYGYLGHEIGHVRHTDFTLLGKLQWKGLQDTLQNIFEDVYMERKIGQEYPGIRSDLKRLVEHLVTEGTFKCATDADHPAVILQRYLLYRMRSEILEQAAVGDIAEKTELVFRAKVSEGFAAKVGSVIARAGAMESTQDACTLTEDLMKIIQDEHEQNQDKAKPGSSNGKTGQQDGIPDGSSPTGNQGQQPGARAGGSPQSGKSSSQVAKEILDVKGDALDKGLAEILQDRLKKKAQEAAAKGSGGSGAGVGEADPPQNSLQGDPTNLVAAARASTNALRIKLGSLIEAAVNDDENLESFGVTLDTMAVQRAVLGDRNIFRSDTEERGVNTAVMIIFDRSGSMRTRIDVARQAALSVCLAMKDLPGVSVGCAAFPSHRGAYEVLPLTMFGESPIATAGRYEMVNASGGTPMTEAIWWGACQLAMRDETRKIMLVVTDGDPDRPQSCDTAIRMLSAQGIEMLGLGIGVLTVKRLFPVSAVINGIDELAPAMFAMLKRSLLSLAA
jgi:cobaltochelatase CobT